MPYHSWNVEGILRRSHDTYGIRRLGFIWGDILPQVPAGTTDAAPKIEREILPSKWGQTSSEGVVNGGTVTHTSEFGITYHVPPQVLYAFSEVRGVTNNSKPVWWDGKTPTSVTRQDFEYSTDLGQPLHQLTYSWLSLPDNEVNFNTGIHDFENGIRDEIENATGSYQVTFAKPYKTVPATPAIWCLTMDYSIGRDAMNDARLRARVEDLTTTGGKRPVSIMTGICGYDINVRDGGRFHVKSQFQGSLENGWISCGADATTQARSVEAMYVAILEN